MEFRSILQAREPADVSSRRLRLAHDVVGLEVRPQPDGRGIDLLAIQDDVDLRDDGLAEEMDIRDELATHDCRLARSDERPLVVGAAAPGHERQGKRADRDELHARPLVKRR